MHTGNSASGSGIGADAAREPMPLTSPLPAAPQSRLSLRPCQGDSGGRSPATQSPPSALLSSRAVVAAAPAAAAASGALSLQTESAGPSNHAAPPLAGSFSSQDEDAAPPTLLRTGSHPTTVSSARTEGREATETLAANLIQGNGSVARGLFYSAIHPSSYPSPRALQDVPGDLSVTTSAPACTTHSSTQRKWEAAPKVAAATHSSASPCSSTPWWELTTPLFRHSPQVRYNCQNTFSIGMGGDGGDRLSATLPGSIVAGTAVAGDAAERVERRPRLPATCSSSSSLSSSSSSPHSPSRADSSTAVSTAGPLPVASVTSVAGGVGNAGFGLLFSLQASVSTLRSSDPEDKAATAELVQGLQEQQQQQRPENASTDVPVGVSAGTHSCEEKGGTDHDCHHRQGLPFGATSSPSDTTRMQQQGPSLQPPESSAHARSEDNGQSAWQNSPHVEDDPHICLCSTEINASGTFLMRCGDEGSFASESVRGHRDVDCGTHHATVRGGHTANHSRISGFVGFDALDDRVSAKAPVAAQYEDEGALAGSHASSFRTFSQELQRTLPPSAVVAASEHGRGLRQQAAVHRPPSQASDAVDVREPDATRQHCPSCADRRPQLHFTGHCSDPLNEAANSTSLHATTPPLRLRTGIQCSALPLPITSEATPQPPTTLPAGDSERDTSGEEELEDVSIDCTSSGETFAFVTAPLSSSSVAETAPRSLWTASMVPHIHGHQTSSIAAASPFRAHAPPPAPLTSTSLLEPPALPSWRRGKLQRLGTPPLASSDLLRLNLLATASAAATSTGEGRSPHTPGSGRESHLMSHVRIALVDLRSVRSHLGELRARLATRRTSTAEATAAHDITGAIAGDAESAGGATSRVSAAAAADTDAEQHTATYSAAGAWARDSAAGDASEMYDGGVYAAAAVHHTAATNLLTRSLLQHSLREGKADGLSEGGGGDSNTLPTHTSAGKSSGLQQRQGLHHSSSGTDADNSNDGTGSSETAFNVRGLYTSSLHNYQHQRLMRLTEHHLKSVWLGVSAIAKSMCGVTLEQCMQMELAQGPVLMDGQAPPFSSDTAAVESAAPSPASSPFGVARRQFYRESPPPPSCTAATASPTSSHGPLQPSDTSAFVQDEEATWIQKASRGASNPPSAAHPPLSMSFYFSEAPLAAAPAEREAAVGGDQASMTVATAKAAVQRLTHTRRDTSRVGCHRDSPLRCPDSAGGDGGAPLPTAPCTGVSTTAANDLTVTPTPGTKGARVHCHSSSEASASSTTQTNAFSKANVSANTVIAQPSAHSDRYRSGGGPHHSSTSPTFLATGSNVSAPGIIYIHNTPTNISSAAALTTALNNVGSGSGSRMPNAPSTSSSACGDGEDYLVRTAASPLSSLPKPTAPTTDTKAGAGQSLYTLPFTLLQLQPPPQRQGSSSQSSTSAFMDGTVPPRWYASLPEQTSAPFFPSQYQPLGSGRAASTSALPSALPHHSSSSLWHSEAGGSHCPLAGATPRPMSVVPPPSPPSPPPPAAVHGGAAAAAAASGASGVLVMALTAPSALRSPYRARTSGVDAGAAAVQGVCTRSSSVTPATPSASLSGSTVTCSLPASMPNSSPLKAPPIKVPREKVAVDTAPPVHANAHVSGAQRDPAALALSTSGTAAHARGECRGQPPTPSALPLTSHERSRKGGVEVTLPGTAAQACTTAAASKGVEARGGTNSAPRNVGAAAALPLATNGSSEGLEELSEPFSLLQAAAAPLPLAQKSHTREDEPMGHWGAQAWPLLQSSLLLLLGETAPASSTLSRSAASTLFGNGDRQLADNGERDGADAAAERERACKRLQADFSTGPGLAEAGNEVAASSELEAGHDLTASPALLRQRQEDEHEADAADAHPRAESARSSSLSYTTISASTAEATSAAMTAISVAGTRVSSTTPSATLSAPLRAELLPGHGGDGATTTLPMAAAGSSLHGLCDDGDTDTIVKRSSSSSRGSRGSSSSSSRGSRGSLAEVSFSHTLPQEALLVSAEDMKRELDVARALMCATSLPIHTNGRATDTDGPPQASSATRSTAPAPAVVVHGMPVVEAGVPQTDALMMRCKGGDGTADTPCPLAPSLVLWSWTTRGGRHVGVCVDSAEVTPNVEHSAALTAIMQPSGGPDMVADAGSCRHDDDDGTADARRRRRGRGVPTDAVTVNGSEDGHDLLSLCMSSNAYDWPSSLWCAAAYQQAQQQQQLYSQRHRRQKWPSILTINSSVLFTTSPCSRRAAITGVVAPGSRLTTSSTMPVGTPTAPVSVAEAVLGIGAAGSALGGGSAGGVPSSHAGACLCIGTSAPSFGAAAVNLTWTPCSTTAFSSDSASATGFTSPSLLFGTTVPSAASYLLSPVRYGGVGSGGAGVGETAEVRSVSPTGWGEGAVLVPWYNANVSAQTEYVFSVAVTATDANGAAAGGGGDDDEGAVRDSDFDALRLVETCNATFAAAGRVPQVPRLLPLHNCPLPLPEAASPCLLDDDDFKENGDNVNAYHYVQDVDGAALLGADWDLQPEEHHRPIAPVCEGGDDSSGVEAPYCDGTSGADSAYGDDNVEGCVAVLKSAVAPSQHHGDGKADVEASPTQPSPGGSTNEGRTLSTGTSCVAFFAADVSGQGGQVDGCSSDKGSRSSRGSGRSHAGGEAVAPSPPLPVLSARLCAPTRVPASDDGDGEGDATAYAAAVSRAVEAHVSRVGEVSTAADDSATEGRTSSAYLSARSLGLLTTRLPAPATAAPASTAAPGTFNAAASTMQGNEAVPVIRFPCNGDDVLSAPSSPLLCTTTASLPSPRMVKDSPLRLGGAGMIIANGDTRPSSTAATATRDTAEAATAAAMRSASEMGRASAPTRRSASGSHPLSGSGNVPTGGNAPAIRNSRDDSDVGGELSSQSPIPLAAAAAVVVCEEGGSRAEVATTTVFEDTATVFITSGLTATQHSSQRPTSLSAVVLSSVPPMSVGDHEAVEKLRDSRGLDTYPMATKAVRIEPTAPPFDGGAIGQPNCKCVGHRERTWVGEGGASTAVESRSDRPGMNSSAGVGVGVYAAALPGSAEEEERKRRHDGSCVADANTVFSGAAHDSGDACPNTSTPLGMTPVLRVAGAMGRDNAAPHRPPHDAVSSTAPERGPSTTEGASCGSPSPPSSLTHLSIPSYYLAQCEDGLADVSGSLHGWHAATSAFFSGSDPPAAPGRTRGGWGSSWSRASHRYTSVSALARRRAQVRAFYNDVRSSNAAAASQMTTTAGHTPSPALAMSVLSSRFGATEDTEKAAMPLTLPSAAVGAAHNNRLLALMRHSLQLTDGESGVG